MARFATECANLRNPEYQSRREFTCSPISRMLNTLTMQGPDTTRDVLWGKIHSFCDSATCITCARIDRIARDGRKCAGETPERRESDTGYGVRRLAVRTPCYGRSSQTSRHSINSPRGQSPSWCAQRHSSPSVLLWPIFFSVTVFESSRMTPVASSTSRSTR